MKRNFTLPISIIIAGLIIGSAVYYAKKSASPSNNADSVPAQKQEIKGPKEITNNDHILGNPNATLSFILYTDFECPFCKKFNKTTKQMMEEYGKQGKVKLVFRHLPIDNLHSKSKKEAEAAECAADINGNEAFWKYIDRLFSITPSNNELDLAELPKIAEYIRIDKDKFNECLNSGKFTKKIQENYEDAMVSGARGTPFFVIINQKGEKFPINGNLSYQELKLILNQLLETKSP